MAIATRVTIEEYLARPFSDDLEYILGEVKEKPVPNAYHGVLASFVHHCFLNYVGRFGGQAGI